MCIRDRGQHVSTSVGLDLARRASREGHWIGNHTWTHTGRLGEMTREAALQEFDRTQQALAWVEQPARLFRPRGGAGRMGKGLLHPAVAEKLIAGGFTCVLWTSVPGLSLIHISEPTRLLSISYAVF